LTHFRGEDSQLEGPIPNIGNSLPKLEVLYAFGNNLTGTIPNFTNQTFLRRINLSDNNLVGTIPYINFTSHFMEFNLSHNHLLGVIPIPLVGCLQNLTIFDIRGNGPISGSFLCNLNDTIYFFDDNVDICNCNEIPTYNFSNCPVDQLTNCAVPCDNFTTVGCIGDQKIIYTDTILTDTLDPGNYIVEGELDINSTIVLSDSSIIISKDLHILPGSYLEIKNSTITIKGNLIMGDNSTTIIDANQPIIVEGCAYLKGTIKTTVPQENVDDTSGTIELIITNCTSGDLNSSVIFPHPDSTASGCFHSHLVKNLFSLDVRFDYACDQSESESIPLELIIGLCAGIPALFILVALLFTVIKPLRNVIYSRKKVIYESDEMEDYDHS
jgi:hypothetical protein